METLSPWSSEAMNFVNKLSDRLVSKTNEPKAQCCMKNIGLAIQRGNAASVIGTFPSGVPLEEIFYLIKFIFDVLYCTVCGSQIKYLVAHTFIIIKNLSWTIRKMN